MDRPRVIDQILSLGADDWVVLGAIIREVEQATKLTNEALRRACLDVIREILTSGLMVVGDVEERFAPWALGTPEAIDRIEREWRALGHDPEPGEICWFDNTPAGDLRARRGGGAEPRT